MAASEPAFKSFPPASILATKTAACTVWPTAKVQTLPLQSPLLFLGLFLFWVSFGFMWLFSGSADPWPQKWSLPLSPWVRGHSFQLYPPLSFLSLLIGWNGGGGYCSLYSQCLPGPISCSQLGRKGKGNWVCRKVSGDLVGHGDLVFYPEITQRFRLF